MRETDEELVARYNHVKLVLAAAIQQRDRLKAGNARDRKSRWVGSLTFTLLQIQSDMQERGLTCSA